MTSADLQVCHKALVTYSMNLNLRHEKYWVPDRKQIGIHLAHLLAFGRLQLSIEPKTDEILGIVSAYLVLDPQVLVVVCFEA